MLSSANEMVSGSFTHLSIHLGAGLCGPCCDPFIEQLFKGYGILFDVAVLPASCDKESLQDSVYVVVSAHWSLQPPILLLQRISLCLELGDALDQHFLESSMRSALSNELLGDFIIML